MKYVSPDRPRTNNSRRRRHPNTTRIARRRNRDNLDAVTTDSGARARDPRMLLALIRFSLTLVWRAARWPFIILIVLQLLAAAALAAQVLAVQWVLDGILALGTTSDLGGLFFAVGALATLTAVTAVIGAVQASVSRYVSEAVSRTTWLEVLDVCSAISLREFESPELFNQIERIRTSALSRPFQATNGLLGVLSAGTATVAVGITIATFHPALLPLLLLSAVPVMLTSRRESKLEFRFNVEQMTAIRHRSYASVLLTGRDEAAEVRAFGTANFLRKRFRDFYDRYLIDLRRHLIHRSVYSVIGQFGAALALAATLMSLVWLISIGGLTVATAGAALVAVRLLASQIQGVAGSIQSIFEAGLFLDDLDKFLSKHPDRGAGLAVTPAPLTFSHINLNDVTFTYPAGSRPAVDGVDLRIDEGEVIALVGENGSGKTTLAKIIAGLYDPDSGSMKWDAADTADLPPGTIPASTSVIMQDFVRYAMDARTNVALGRIDQPVDEQRVVDAATNAGAEDFVEKLPHAWDTMLTRLFDGGQDLSGGQWQRIAIARAFYRDAPLVILDEPSAALDPRAEADLFTSLRRTLEGRSAVIISHRFSTVRDADRIYVLDNGKVLEHGSHDQLMAAGGRYAELFSLQASAYLDRSSGETTPSTSDS